jgi:tetratricopeptide (TPR) repeat protein
MQALRSAWDDIRSGNAGRIGAGLAALKRWTESSPGDASASLEDAGAFDFLGREKEAAPLYAKVGSLGWQKLPEIERPHFFLQYGSTLRNLGRLDEALALLREGVMRFPAESSLRALLGLAEYSRGDHRSAALSFASALASEAKKSGGLGGFSRAFAEYTPKLS